MEELMQTADVAKANAIAELDRIDAEAAKTLPALREQIAEATEAVRNAELVLQRASEQYGRAYAHHRAAAIGFDLRRKAQWQILIDAGCIEPTHEVEDATSIPSTKDSAASDEEKVKEAN